MATPYETALRLIDEAHSQDPNLITLPSSSNQVPRELHYANQMTKYLDQHTPSASPTLRIAIRAQHLKRWEVPRSAYPLTKPGYYSWRSSLARRQADIAYQMCISAGVAAGEAERVAALIRKEGLKKDDAETQALEDVACLVFLDDGLVEFENGFAGGEEKVVDILRKTWGKMGPRGRELALGLGRERGGRIAELVGMALNG